MRSDDENRPIFDSAKEEVITHAFDDNLQNVSISMKPDRVIGLRALSRIPQNASHFPVKGRRILLPFLIIEAKREEDVPGFRAIQYQTAFPVRRLLKAQADLLDGRSSSELCLVWFFANQGEQWQLHTGTYEDSKFVSLTRETSILFMLTWMCQKIYDLWQGTIQSQDGALQLLLIVDYIWSWARDIYRPSVKNLLLDSIQPFRDSSPASTYRFRQSTSLSSAPSPAPTRHDSDLMQIDHIMADTKHPRGPHQRVNRQSQEIDEQETAVMKDTNLHPFLRWASDPEFAHGWTDHGCIRYPNIVRFEFRCLEIWESDIIEMERADPDNRVILDFLSSLAVLIQPEQLHELAALWTTNFTTVSELGLKNAMRATFIFQTYCDQTTWQIKRVLNCLLWRTEPFTLSSNADIAHPPAYVCDNGKPHCVEMNDIKAAILDTQQIHGRDSVWYALRDVSMALVHGKESCGPEWVLFQEAEVPNETSRFLKGLTEGTGLGKSIIGDVNVWSSLLQIDPDSERRLRSTVPDLGRDTRKGNSMLAVRSPSWPSVCPRFCLFVLLGGIHDKNVIRQLLEEAKSLENFYSAGDCQLSRTDWKNLRSWSKTLQGRD